MGTLRKVAPLLGESEAIERLRDFIVGVSLIEDSVLLCGDYGTGKDLSAQKIHAVGRTSRAPFIRVSCQRFRESELECLLFGNEGAEGITGLLGSRSGSTCHLAGIEFLPKSFSRRLCRYLYEQEPRDSGRPRLIFSSRFDRDELDGGNIVDPDFLQRISEFYMRIPPLRERVEDIPVLCRYQLWLNCAAEVYETRWTEFGRECLTGILSYPWPGNVTELNGYVRAYCGAGTSPRRHLTDTLESPLPRPELYLEEKLRESYADLLALLALESHSGRDDLVIPRPYREQWRDHEN